MLAWSGGASALSPQQVFAARAGGVAALEILDASGRRAGLHSATQVAAGRFVTSCEVLEAAHSLRLRWPAGPDAGVVGVIAARDRERNLCLLDAQPGAEQAGHAVPLQPVLPTVGSRVFALSNALGFGVGISEGVVSGVRHFSDGDYLQFTAPISPGSEGGALVDEEGRLVGVLDYRRRDGQNVNFAPVASAIGEVPARAQAAAAQLQRFDAATVLRTNKQWTELAALATEWLRLQPDQPDALRFAIAAAAGLKDAAGELASWRALSRVSPDRPEVGLGLGEALLARGLLEETRSHAEQLIAAHPEYAKAYWLLGRAQQAGGANTLAEASLRRAIERDTWLVAAYENLAQLAQARGDHETSIAIWSRLSGLYADALRPRIALARAYMAAGRNQRAYTALQTLPAAEQDGAYAWFWRGVVLMRLAAPDAAVLAYRNSLDRQLEFPAEAWRGIGEAMASMLRWPESIAAYQSAVAAAPAEDDYRASLAWALNRGGRSDEALPLITALTEKTPKNASYWFVQGGVLQRLDRPAQAAAAMEHALELMPRNATGWSELVVLRRSAGQHQQAREAYQQLLTLDGQAAAGVYRRGMLPFEGAAP